MSREILKHIIDNFLPENFIDFFRIKNRSFKPHAEQSDEYNDNDFKDALSIGQIPFHQTENLIIYSFKATKNLSERSGKKLQYEKGKKILKDTQADAGIFIFYDTNNDLRFSLIYPEYSGTQRQWSSFKRFTYFVSPEETNKTFIQRIGDGDFSSIDAIKETFSVEKVTKAFYSEIANWYFWAAKNTEFPIDVEKEENGRNIAVIRMITRLIFIWFMKVRGLVPDELFKEDKIKEILTDKSPDESTYYKAILQNLFFATLNTRQEQRKFRTEVRGHKGYNPDYGNHGVYRYLKLFKNPESIEEYFGKIPFLNGGLFECLDFKSQLKEDRVYIDGFTDVAKHQPSVPNLLFFSKERDDVDLNKEFGTQNRTYKVRGLFDLLTSYNFTIDENEPDDQEVALDPELLGRVFENLLASYNPETATTARKATGSYYTPREIVDYMVTQSLIKYFKSHLPEDKGIEDKIFRLFSNRETDNPFDEATTKKIIQLIESLRIVDPAVGTGAFPMGMLNRLVFILHKLDPDNILWKQAQIDAIKENVKDPVLQRNLILQVEEKFKDKNADYGRKLYLIEKCIYGVDIQQIAVEIAKLRFFISLLVDEKIDPKKPNLGIEPLPNLDFKLMQGNSLISSFADIDFDRKIEAKGQITIRLNTRYDQLINQFEENKDQYQNEPDKDKKDNLRKEIENILLKIFEEKINEQLPELKRIEEKYAGIPHPAKRAEYITAEKQKLCKKLGFDLEQAEKDLIAYTEGRKPKDFFLWGIYFAEVFYKKGGFDVVIANPPYFNISTIKKDFYRYLAEHYKSIHTGYNDIVYYFIYLGIELLNKDGCCTFITSNYFLGNEYAKKLRIYLRNHTAKVINFKDYMVFDAASIHTCISISYKKPKDDDIAFFEPTADEQITSSNIEAGLRSFTINRAELNDNWIIADQSASSIINKINKATILLGNISIIKKGATSGDREIFTIRKSFAEENRFENELLKTSINSKDIKRYLLADSGEYLIYVDNNTDIKKYPNIYKYLLIHQKTLSKRNEVVNGVYPWYRLERPREKEVFNANEKIVVPYRAENNMFAYDNKQGFNDGGGSYAIVMKDDKVNIKYVLALLNSKLIDWFYGFIGKLKGKVREYFNKPLSLIPIKRISLAAQQPFITLVDQILSAKKKDPNADTSALEHQIDKMVYELYGLTPEEIEIVEGKK